MATVKLPGGESFDTEPSENLLSAAQRAHWLVRHGCRNGNCGVCCATLLRGEVETPQGVVTSDGEPEILLCRSRIERDIEIRLPGNPRHGSFDQARRRSVRLQSVTPTADGQFRLRLQLPAGRRPPVYPGQYLLIDEEHDGGAEPLRAEIDLEQSADRSLSVIVPRLPLADDDHLRIRYPLGYTFITAPPQPPVWIVHGAARAQQARLLHQFLPRATLLQVGGGRWLPPPLRGSPLVLACAACETQAQQWFEALLAAGLTPVEFRSDFAVWSSWRVMRQDDNGNRFEVESGLTETQARERAEALTETGHKQLYWAEPATT